MGFLSCSTAQMCWKPLRNIWTLWVILHAFVTKCHLKLQPQWRFFFFATVKVFLTKFVSYQIYPSVMKNLISICSVRLLRSCCRFRITYNQHALSHRLTFGLWSSLRFPSLLPSPMPILYLPLSCVPISPCFITGAWLWLLCSILFWIALSFGMDAVLNLAMASASMCKPQERNICTLIQMLLFLQRDAKCQFARSVWPVWQIVSEVHVRWTVSFCLALERGFSCGVLQCGIDLFTSPSNIALV